MAREESLTLRAAVVGAGLMGRWHAHSLARAGGSLVAVVDQDPQQGGDFAARRFSTLAEALERAEPDVVHVCTPTDSHAELALEALAAGADVLVEKPLAPDAAATERLLARATSAGRLLCPVHQYLFQPGFLALERAAPGLGAWRHLEIVMCSAGAEGRSPAEADAIALEILPHPLAVLNRLLPGVEWSSASLAEGELRAFGAAGPTSVLVCISMGGRPRRNDLTLIGSDGSFELDFSHGYGFVERGRATRAGKALRPFAQSARRATAAGLNLGHRTLRKEPAYPGLRPLIEDFYAAARTRGEPPLTSAETLAVALARDALQELAGS